MFYSQIVYGAEVASVALVTHAARIAHTVAVMAKGRMTGQTVASCHMVRVPLL